MGPRHQESHPRRPEGFRVFPKRRDSGDEREGAPRVQRQVPEASVTVLGSRGKQRVGVPCSQDRGGDLRL